MADTLTHTVDKARAWAARTDNPNEVTAEQVGSVNKAGIDGVLSLYADLNTLPISYFGDCLDIRTLSIAAGTNGTTFNWADTPAMFAGIDAVLKAGSVDINTLTSEWQNATGYLFVQYDGTDISWLYSPYKNGDSGFSFRVGTVVCDGSKITSLSLSKVFLLGTMRAVG